MPLLKSAVVRSWWLRAAELGDTHAIVGLGVLLTDTSRAQARRWFQRAADASRADGMAGPANLAADSDPAQARRRVGQAAGAGGPPAPPNFRSPHRWFSAPGEAPRSGL